MKINQIRLSCLRNDTHFQFHTEFKDLAQKHDPDALKIRQQHDAYLPLYALLLVEKSGNYEAFIKKLIPIISKYSITLAARADKVSKKKGGGKNSTTGGSHEEH